MNSIYLACLVFNTVLYVLCIYPENLNHTVILSPFCKRLKLTVYYGFSKVAHWVAVFVFPFSNKGRYLGGNQDMMFLFPYC